MAYVVGQVVRHLGRKWVCIKAHTYPDPGPPNFENGGSAGEPGVGSDWRNFWLPQEEFEDFDIMIPPDDETPTQWDDDDTIVSVSVPTAVEFMYGRESGTHIAISIVTGINSTQHDDEDSIVSEGAITGDEEYEPA